MRRAAPRPSSTPPASTRRHRWAVVLAGFLAPACATTPSSELPGAELPGVQLPGAQLPGVVVPGAVVAPAGALAVPEADPRAALVAAAHAVLAAPAGTVAVVHRDAVDDAELRVEGRWDAGGWEQVMTVAQDGAALTAVVTRDRGDGPEYRVGEGAWQPLPPGVATDVLTQAVDPLALLPVLLSAPDVSVGPDGTYRARLAAPDGFGGPTPAITIDATTAVAADGTEHVATASATLEVDGVPVSVTARWSIGPAAPTG